MWVAQVPALSRMFGGLFWLSKVGSSRCLMASSPFERDVPTIPAAKPTMAKTMPCRIQGSLVIKTRVMENYLPGEVLFMGRC